VGFEITPNGCIASRLHEVSQSDSHITLLTQTQRKILHSPGPVGFGEIMTDCEWFDMTWGSSASSGYCSQSDSEHELEQFYTARTSLRKTKKRKDKVRQ